ncbi:MAG: AhpC/TSA family protein [Paludibacter sp.]|nr:AhpC/TSA family protein [Paludibacter sp.]
MKNVLIITISVLCLFACTSSKYEIEGKVEAESLNGTTIFLKERINRIWISIDSAVIENHKFIFNGVSDSAKIIHLAYEFPTDNRVRQALVLENGNIKVSIDTTGFMTFEGTAQNDLLQTYQIEKNIIANKANEFYKALEDSSISEEKRLIITKEIDSLNKKDINIDKKYAIENVNTLVGTHIFMNSFFGMTTAEKESIVSSMNDETIKVKRITEIIGDIATEKRVAVGSMYTDFTLPNLSGDSISLSGFVGKSDYLLIDFWASWCGPCIKSLPEMKYLFNKYKGERFNILGVSLDENKEAWVGAINSHELIWNHISDLKGWKCEGSRTYAVNSIPCTVLINKEGIIVGRNLSISEIEKIINKKETAKR